MSDVVSLTGFTRRFGDRVVLDRLDLHVAPGEFVALLGRSGSGKTTLLRSLAGLDAVEEGQLVVPEHRAVVFQEARLLPWKRVWENVVLGLPEAGRKGAGRDAALAALREVSLDHRADAWPATLSGGEAQRAGLARALARSPELLLLDEPFAALDALTRLRMQSLVASLWTQHKAAVLLVTHDVDEALMLADRAVVLDAGRITTALSIDLPRPRRHSDPGFEALRERLLSALGVEDRVIA